MREEPLGLLLHGLLKPANHAEHMGMTQAADLLAKYGLAVGGTSGRTSSGSDGYKKVESQATSTMCGDDRGLGEPAGNSDRGDGSVSCQDNKKPEQVCS